MSQLSASGGQSIGVSASASVSFQRILRTDFHYASLVAQLVNLTHSEKATSCPKVPIGEKGARGLSAAFHRLEAKLQPHLQFPYPGRCVPAPAVQPRRQGGSTGFGNLSLCLRPEPRGRFNRGGREIFLSANLET